MNIAIIILFIALSAADVVTTLKGLKDPNLYEGTTIAAKLFDRFGELPTMVAIKTFFTAALALVLYGHPATTFQALCKWTFVAGLIAGGVYTVANNLKMLGEER